MLRKGPVFSELFLKQLAKAASSRGHLFFSEPFAKLVRLLQKALPILKKRKRLSRSHLQQLAEVGEGQQDGQKGRADDNAHRNQQHRLQKACSALKQPIAIFFIETG